MFRINTNLLKDNMEKCYTANKETHLLFYSVQSTLVV